MSILVAIIAGAAMQLFAGFALGADAVQSLGIYLLGFIATYLAIELRKDDAK